MEIDKNIIDDRMFRFRVTTSALLAITCCVLYIVTDQTIAYTIEYGIFFVLGIFGALIANSTGSGGGIVFVPAFSFFNLNDDSALATSFLIQSFGMTMGAITWLYSFQHRFGAERTYYSAQISMLKIVALPAIIGVLCGQYVISPPAMLTTVFSIFTFIIGVVLLINTYIFRKTKSTKLISSLFEKNILIFGGFLGGIITAWISIGVGEVIALLLIIMRFPTSIAICSAICVSALSVIVGSMYHLFVSSSIEINILLYAVPGALLGGLYAKYIADYLGPYRLKYFISVWIIVTAILI